MRMVHAPGYLKTWEPYQVLCGAVFKNKEKYLASIGENSAVTCEICRDRIVAEVTRKLTGSRRDYYREKAAEFFKTAEHLVSKEQREMVKAMELGKLYGV